MVSGQMHLVGVYDLPVHTCQFPYSAMLHDKIHCNNCGKEYEYDFNPVGPHDLGWFDPKFLRGAEMRSKVVGKLKKMKKRKGK